MPTIRLQSSDGEIFVTDVEVAKCFVAIKIMLEAYGLRVGDDTIIPLPSVKAPILRKALEWAQHYKNHPEPPYDDAKPIKNLPQWYVDFFNVDQDTLFDLAMAAHYLDALILLEYTAKAVANLMAGKSAEQLRKMLNLDDDIVTAEQEQSRSGGTNGEIDSEEAEWYRNQFFGFK